MDLQSKDLSALMQEMSSRLESDGNMRSRMEISSILQPPSYETVHDTEAKQPLNEDDLKDGDSTQKKFTHECSSSEDSDSDASDTAIKTRYPIRDETILLKQIENLQKEQEKLRKKQEIHEKHIKELMETEPSVLRQFNSLRKSFSAQKHLLPNELKNLAFIPAASVNELRHSKVTDTRIHVQLEQLYANFHVLHFPSKTALNILSGDNTMYSDAYSINEITSLRKKVKELEGQLQTMSTFSKAVCLLEPDGNAQDPRIHDASYNTLCGIPGQPTSPIPVPPAARDVCPVEVTVKWTICDYLEKLWQEKNNENHKEISSPFYLTHCGYRAQIEAYLNGNGTGRNKCMSVFLRVIKGDYDHRLQWPVNLHMVVVLVNQTGNHSESLKAMGNQFQFSRPCGSLEAESDCWGLIEFVSHEVIRQREYIKADKIMLKCRLQILYPDQSR